MTKKFNYIHTLDFYANKTYSSAKETAFLPTVAAGFCHWILCWQHTNDSFLTADSFSSDFVQWFKAWCQARGSHCASPGTSLKMVEIMLESTTGSGFVLESTAINFSKAEVRQITWICFLTWETGGINRLLLCWKLAWKWCMFWGSFLEQERGN